jgi:hypothetical protein
MAYKADEKFLPAQYAGGDLSLAQHRFGKIGSTGVIRATTAGERVDGVIQNTPDAAGKAVQLAYLGITKTEAGAAIAKGALVMTNADGKAITAAAAPTAATKTCSAETYNLNPGDTIVVDVDNVGNAPATWDAAAATITDTTTYPVADQDTLTMTITITGGEYDGVLQTVTFARVTTTALLVAEGINDQAKGVSASVTGGQVVLTTDVQGSGAAIATGAGTGALTWAASVDGTGDAVDINAVTAAEVKTVIEADTTATVSISGGVPTISSPTTGTTSELDFISGNALTPLGLSVETIVGTNDGTYSAGKAMEAATADGDIIGVLLETAKN